MENGPKARHWETMGSSPQLDRGKNGPKCILEGVFSPFSEVSQRGLADRGVGARISSLAPFSYAP